MADDLISSLMNKACDLVWDWQFEGGGRPSDAQILVADLILFDTEVCNGGFWQYLFNSSGDHAHLLVLRLSYVGAGAIADIAERAMSLLGQGTEPISRDQRMEMANEVKATRKDELYALDDEYFDTNDTLWDYLREYVEANKEQFE